MLFLADKQDMTCKNCSIKPVYIDESKKKYCSKCFVKYFEAKVFKTIRAYNLVENSDRIGVGVSGGKDSLTTLHLLNKLAAQRRKLKITAILIDEGIHGYREKTIKDAKRFCKKEDIELYIYSYKKEFGSSLDQAVKKLNSNACAICGVFRRYLLNRKSRELGLNKLAVGHNLDDEAQAILMNQFKNNVGVSARLGPITGIIKEEKFIPRIKPLYFMTEKEVTIYSYIKGFTTEFSECPNSFDSFRSYVRDMLNEAESKYPGIKRGVIHSFLEVLPRLKEEQKKTSKMKFCSNCAEPCTGTICKACQIMNSLKSV